MVDFKKHLRSTKVVKPFNELNEDEMIALLQTIFEQAGAPIRYINMTKYGPCIFVGTHDIRKMQKAHNAFKQKHGNHAISIIPG